VKTYRTAAIHPHDVVARRDGIRVTTRARTAFDLARHLRADDLLSVIEQALHDGRIDDDVLRRVAVDWLSPRRPWARAFLRQLDRRLMGGTAESHPEVRVGTALAECGVRGLVRQHELDIPGYGPARFDLAVPKVRWAIEIDVFPTHDQTIGRLRDRRRDAAAVNCGWTTTRLERTEYEVDFDGWIERTAAHYRTLRRPS
jgi:very-short-patch-repair endonuclease